jgi:hypothetical protein
MKMIFMIGAMLVWGAPALLIGQPLSPPKPAPALGALASLQPGQWQLRMRGRAAAPKSLCLSDTHALLQIRHSGAACSRFVIASDARTATVHYTCPGAGHGRTTIRVENSRLAQIDSQGVAENQPFALVYEGRRVGECAAPLNAANR